MRPCRSSGALMRDLVIVGAGGVGRALRQFVEDCNAVAPRWLLRGFVDDAEPKAGIDLVAPMLGPLARLGELSETGVLVGVGSPATRMKVVDRLRSFSQLGLPALVHPRAYIPGSVPVGRGNDCLSRRLHRDRRAGRRLRHRQSQRHDRSRYGARGTSPPSAPDVRSVAMSSSRQGPFSASAPARCRMSGSGPARLSARAPP